MEFRILGTVEVVGEHGQARLGTTKQLALLVELLTHANRLVSADQIISAVWGTNLPEGTGGALHTVLSRLRRELDRIETGGAARIVTHPTGYMLRVAPGELDADVFHETVATARKTTDPGRAIELYRAALALWRGPAFAGARVDSLEEAHIIATEELVDARLATGAHAELVPELTEMVARHPLRERMRGQLMLALYRDGRQADALAAYQEFYRLLDDELAIQPGEALQELHGKILAADPGLITPVGRADVPRQLPADVAGFAGRTRHLAALDDLLDHGGKDPLSIRITTITGVPGVGKTALALRWAHRIAHRVPDGQLYLNLRGYAQTQPMTVSEALPRLLRGLGVPPERVPVAQDEQAAMYRSLMAARRALIVLDNAASSQQVRPLLPGSATCVVVVTSRDALGGLTAMDSARPLPLDVLTTDEAHALVAGIIGAGRVTDEREDVARLAELCGYLPLSLRIAAAHLAGLPRRSIADYVAELAAGERLSRLAIAEDPDAAVRASFDLSYQKLETGARRLFRLLGLVPGPDLTLPAVAAVADCEIDEAAELLNRLVAAHLVEAHTSGRYQFHDLLRLYAGEQTRAEDTAQERENALRRLFDWYLHTADGAAALLNPGIVRLTRPPVSPDVQPLPFENATEASVWLDAERANLVAAARYAADEGPRHIAWHLADALRGYFHFRLNGPDWLDTASAGLLVAQDDRDEDGVAAMRRSLAHALFNRGDYEKSLEAGFAARDHYRQVGDTVAELELLKWCGLACWRAGRLDDALEQFTPALDGYRASGAQPGVAIMLNSIGLIFVEMGRFAEAIELDREALAIQQELGIPYNEPISRQIIGRASGALGRYDDAIAEQTKALALYRSSGYRYGEATVLNTMSVSYLETGRHAEALRHGQESLSLARELGVRSIQVDALNVIAAVELDLGRFDDALASSTQAVNMAQEHGFPRGVIDGLIVQAGAYRRLGKFDQAVAAAEAAINDAHARKYRPCEGQAHTVLAETHRDAGRDEPATEHATRALTIHRQIGYRFGETRASNVLS